MSSGGFWSAGTSGLISCGSDDAYSASASATPTGMKRDRGDRVAALEDEVAGQDRGRERDRELEQVAPRPAPDDDPAHGHRGDEEPEAPEREDDRGSRQRMRSVRASRSVAACDFYQGYLLTDIAPDELLIALDFHLPPADSGWCCTEMARRHGDFAIVAVAVLLGCGRDRRIDFARVALGGVGPAPLRMSAAEQALLGERPGAELFRRAADVAAQAVDPPADIHASSSYRRHLAGVLVRRALATAASRITGSAS